MFASNCRSTAPASGEKEVSIRKQQKQHETKIPTIIQVGLVCLHTNDADDIKRTVSNTEKQNANETITFQRHLTDRPSLLNGRERNFKHTHTRFENNC